MRALTVLGWPLSVDDDGVHRARDIDLGEKLGLERPRKLRDLVASAPVAPRPAPSLVLWPDEVHP